MDHQLHFNMTLRLTKGSDGGKVYFKVDGQRFRNTKTVKLHSGIAYRLDISFKPTQILESFNVHGVNLPLQETSDEDSQVSSYTATWSTEGIPLTKKGEREHVPMIFKIAGKGTLKISLQAKFYKADDIHHCEWGTHVRNIEFECNANEHRNHVDVAKETFR